MLRRISWTRKPDHEDYSRKLGKLVRSTRSDLKNNPDVVNLAAVFRTTLVDSASDFGCLLGKEISGRVALFR